MENFEFWHKANIIVHVSTGLIALILGITALTTPKGRKTHRKSGKLFLCFLTIVVFTGLLGVLIFKVNQFLLVITVLSGYNAYSGIRVLKNKTNQINRQDILVGIFAASTGIYFIFYMKSIGMFWSPVIIYATLGALFSMILYDILRYLIPSKKYGNLWLYEHIYKMIAAFTALLAAATGTVFDEYQPHSQYLPSLFGTVLTIVFIVYFYRKNNSTKNETAKKNS
jgi:uncharacterized membrane protein